MGHEAAFLRHIREVTRQLMANGAITGRVRGAIASTAAEAISAPAVEVPGRGSRVTPALRASF